MASTRVQPGLSVLGPTPPPPRPPNQPNRPQVGRNSQPPQVPFAAHQQPTPPSGQPPSNPSRGRGGRQPGRHNKGRGSRGGESGGGGSPAGGGDPGPGGGGRGGNGGLNAPVVLHRKPWWIRLETPGAMYPAEFDSDVTVRHFELALFQQVAADSFTWAGQQARRNYTLLDVINEMQRWYRDYPGEQKIRTTGC